MDCSYISDKKAQTALEVILIVAGVIVLVMIIGYYIKTTVVQLQDTNRLSSVISKAAKN